jgi:hypothetical protein
MNIVHYSANLSVFARSLLRANNVSACAAVVKRRGVLVLNLALLHEIERPASMTVFCSTF